MIQEPAATPTPGRPPLPLLDLTVVEAFDLHPGLRRVVFTCADGLPGYKPGNDLVFLLPLPDGTEGRRHYTIRGADAAKGTLWVDFVMHADTPGPALPGPPGLATGCRRADPGGAPSCATPAFT